MPKSDQIEYQLIAQELKLVLKKQKITYLQLSQMLGVSESTTKRIFTSKDGTFSKISQVCELLGISLFDLINKVSDKKSRKFKFTIDQEKFFSKNLSCLSFFYELYDRGLSLKEVQHKYKIKNSSIFKYLNKLDTIGLITLHAKNKFIFKVNGRPSWNRGGPLHHKLSNTFTDFPKKKIEEIVKGKTTLEKDTYLHITDTYLTSDSLAEIFHDLKLLQEKIYKKGDYDQMATLKKELIKTKTFFCVGPDNEYYGDIKNI